MLASLICEQKIYRIHLPEKVSGKYWITDAEEKGDGKILGIEAADDGSGWMLPRQNGVLLGSESGNYEAASVLLQPGRLYDLKLADFGIAALFTEPFTKDRRSFRKFTVKSGAQIRVGRSGDNDLIFQDPYVGSHHLTLEYRKGIWTLTDHASANGTYVNQRKVSGTTTLSVGDTILVLGFQCVIGRDFLAVNDPDNRVKINGTALTAASPENWEEREGLPLPEKEYYYRSPRFQRKLTPLVLKVDMPTRREDKEERPFLLAIGPALVMGCASFSVGILAMISALAEGRSLISTLPTMITATAMLVGMILFPFLMRRREKREKTEKEKERREKYLAYLKRMRDEIERNQVQQRDFLHTGHPAILSYAGRADFWERHLWEISEDQTDFLRLRIGIGNAPMAAEIEFPEERFTIEDDVMREELLAFQREERLLLNVPITLSLPEHRVIGIVGNEEGRTQAVYNLLLQLLLLHSYDEVKLICLCGEKDEKHLSFLRYARHAWDDEGRQRYLAITAENLRELSMTVNKLIAERRERLSEGETVAHPHYVLLVTDREMAIQCDFLQEVLGDPALPGFSVIFSCEDVKELPKECRTVLEVNGAQGILTDGKYNADYRTNFVQDSILFEDAKDLVRHMAEFELDLHAGRYDLPEVLPFMELFGVGRCEHLNVLARWERNDPTKSLRAPIGLDTFGSVLYLDLHEKFHGPHGLIAGMTGSGKSEFVITYVLSLAINYHPDEVSFVLIDYKGGGLAGAFDNEHYRLPHLVGTITNLDGDSVMRSILSIKSELRRRQAIFNEARVIANEGTMDIYKYQKMVRDGLMTEPMPHLFIISDEFAELKSQQPEFMDQLISTARIGRSLGVHLILATQKPAGVVNDQIWANSRFKVCLKVQDRADSNDMLKRPDAAELKETGRFYLQIGYNESFEQGQSAWSGAPYPAHEAAEAFPDNTIEIIDELGNVTDKIRPAQRVVIQESDTQIVRIMEHLDSLARSEHLIQRSLWLPEMPGIIVMKELLQKYEYQKTDALVGVIGELDDPYRQSKRLLTLDFTGGGNALVYGAAGSGKEMLIEAVLYSLCENYGPDELNTYLLDFDSEALRAFLNAPQTGNVILDGDTEELRSFFRMLQKELRTRKKRFSEFGGDYLQYKKSGGEALPYILVVLHNYSHFYESYEQYDDLLVSLSRECPKYGIYFLLTGTSAGAVRYRLAQNFSQFFVLQLNDASDYTSILGRTDGIYPSKYTGRGILKSDETYVFQTASILAERKEQTEYLRKMCDAWRERWPESMAKSVPVVPKFVSGQTLRERGISAERFPLGIGLSTYAPVCRNLEKQNLLYVLAADKRELIFFAGGILEEAGALPGTDIVVLDPTGELRGISETACEEVTSDYEKAVVRIFETAVARNNNYKETNGKPTVDRRPTLFLIHEYGRLKKALSDDGQDKLKVLLSKTEGFCNMYFIITDTYRASNAYSAEEWIAERSAGSGLWLGAGFDDQLRFVVPNRRYTRQEEDSRTGILVERGKAERLRYVMLSHLQEEIENEE